MVPVVLALHLVLASTEPAAPAAAPARDVVAEPALGPSPAAAPGPRLAAMTLAPRQLDPGPFRGGELMGATVGAFAGDALVLGSGYVALRMFAGGAFAPTATNFRRAAYGLGVGALVVPPLTAVLMASLVGGPHARGGFWKAVLFASVGQVAALAAGYYMAPRFWVVLPVQAVAVSLGASFGLHLGSSPRALDRREAPDEAREPKEAPPDATAARGTPLCTES